MSSVAIRQGISCVIVSMRWKVRFERPDEHEQAPQHHRVYLSSGVLRALRGARPQSHGRGVRSRGEDNQSRTFYPGGRISAGLRRPCCRLHVDASGRDREQVVVPERIYISWINTTIVGGLAPDLMLHTGATHEFLLREFESLNEIVEEPNPYNAGTDLAELPWRETFLDGLSGNPAYKPNLVSYYGIPITSRTTRALYNKTLLREITESEYLPSTFGEFVALCEQAQRYAEGKARTLFPIAASGKGDDLLRRLVSSQTQRTALELDVVTAYPTCHGRDRHRLSQRQVVLCRRRPASRPSTRAGGTWLRAAWLPPTDPSGCPFLFLSGPGPDDGGAEPAVSQYPRTDAL